MARPRALRGEDEARQIGARFGCDGNVLLAGQSADLDQGARQELAQLLARVGCLHQRRADEDRVRPGELRGGALRARVDTALGDRDPVGGDPRDKVELRAAVDREGGEVAGVDADDRRSERDRALELVGVVRLDERVQTELVGSAHERGHAAVVEVSQEEQHSVRARFPGRVQMLIGREETLREQRQPDTGSGGSQIVPVAAEALVDEDRDDRSAGALVVGGESAGLGVGPDVTERGRATLELGNRAETGPRPRRP